MRIIPHDPNSSRYCRRIAEIEWEDQKVFLGKLHNEGFTKDQMVKQLADERNFRVTKNRLDKQMNKWGFSRHRRPSSRIHLSAGHSSPNNTAAGAVTAVIEQDSSPNPHVVGHTSSAQQHEPQDPVLMSGSIPTMPSPNSGGKYSPTPPSEDAAVAGLATVPETSGGDPMLPRVDSHSGALCLDPYLFSHRMLALSRETEEHPDLDIRPSRKLVAFNKAGALLHSLKAFDMAFEFYFIVLQDQNMVTDVPTSDLVIAVLNCARSASTPNQMQVAHNAAGTRQHMLEITQKGRSEITTRREKI
ncbi:hypothetical protein H2200_010264 [Cladophialophora chaetospira]|uniref:Clr5 domain-containing protein n=1 Tax=Cladophialophora chaetospira TaxID=386627 RepID=A0AA38X2K8_9EURO|nr:hypothetical protein H2200_010264 [Cladophialophora chaetospira]